VQKLGGPPDAKDQLSQQRPELVEETRNAELEWRRAVDALFLIAGEAVAEAGRRHLEAQWRKIDAAWLGERHSTLDTYQNLNDAMRSELLDRLSGAPSGGLPG
jgi:hypothetical protein